MLVTFPIRKWRKIASAELCLSSNQFGRSEYIMNKDTSNKETKPTKNEQKILKYIIIRRKNIRHKMLDNKEFEVEKLFLS